MGRKGMILLAVFMLLFGVGTLLYPTISSMINRQHGSYAIQEMQEQLDEMDSAEMEAALAEGRSYNEMLRNAVEPDAGQYEKILDFGNGIMGWIKIETINVKLPIYHGVSTEVLEKGIGHLPSSAFPIGGTGNHTVLTGHTGLPSAELFTDLTELAIGDSFQITVASETAHYQVDQIRTVLPEETEELMSVPGEDYCTLVTCTPYGVNSHRLLVRGSRVEMPEGTPVQTTQEEPESGVVSWWLLLLPIPFIGLLLLVKRKKGNA